MPRISPQLDIPDAEFTIRFQSSSGPGGQNVNKTATRAIVSFDLAASPSLSPVQRAWLTSKLQSRLTTEGVLSVSCEDSRSQLTNRRLAMERMIELLQNALRRPKTRRPTRPSKGSIQRRLKAKSHRSQTKRNRGGRSDHDEH